MSRELCERIIEGRAQNTPPPLCFEKYTETAHIEAYFSKQNLREVLGNEVICKKTIGRLS